jgi:hypothetical protein
LGFAGKNQEIRTMVKKIIKKIIKKCFASSFYDLKNELVKELNVEKECCDCKESQILLKLKYQELLKKGVKELPSFDDVGFRKYSQFEEDGILLYIFSVLGVTNKTTNYSILTNLF